MQVKSKFLGFVGVVAGIIVWQIVAATDVFGEGAIPTVTAVAEALIDAVLSMKYWSEVGVTTLLWLIGLSCVVILALPAGVVLAEVATLRAWTQSTIDFLRSIPHIAFIPLALVLIGSNPIMVTVMVVVGAIWPLLLQTIAGVTSVDRVTKDTARSLQLSTRQRVTRVTGPAAMPFVLTGLKISASLALIIVVVTGMLGGTPGLGREIVSAQESFQTPLLYAYLVTIGVMGFGINVVFELAERRLLAWRG